MKRWWFTFRPLKHGDGVYCFASDAPWSGGTMVEFNPDGEVYFAWGRTALEARERLYGEHPFLRDHP